MNVIEFLNSPLRSTDIEEGNFAVYVRKSLRHVNGTLLKAFDIAKIESKVHGSGDFWKFVEKVEHLLIQTKEATGIQMIFIENVLNERLEASLPKHGFIKIEQREDIGPPCFYKKIGR